eukprot:218855-Rhodomonas_salina.1
MFFTVANDSTASYEQAHSVEDADSTAPCTSSLRSPAAVPAPAPWTEMAQFNTAIGVFLSAALLVVLWVTFERCPL